MQLVPKHLQKRIQTHTNFIEDIKVKSERMSRFNFAYHQLVRIANAKVVITSRIHVALPAIAMGIPTIFVSPKNRNSEIELPGGKYGRTDGLLSLFYSVLVLENTSLVYPLESFDWDMPTLTTDIHAADRYRTSFWGVIKNQYSVTQSAKIFGVVPFERLGSKYHRVSFEKKFLFHFMRIDEKDNFNLSDLRAVESVFFHYPNARVLIYDKELSPLLQILIDGGYDIVLGQGDSGSLLHKAASIQGSKIDKNLVRKFASRSGNRMWLTVSSDILRLCLIYIYGGFLLNTNMLLLRHLPDVPNFILFDHDDIFLRGMLKFEATLSTYIASCINAILSRYFETIYVGTNTLMKYVLHKESASKIVSDDFSVPVLYSDHVYKVSSDEISMDQCYSKNYRDSLFNGHQHYHAAVLNFNVSINLSKKKFTQYGSTCFHVLNDFCVSCSLMI